MEQISISVIVPVYNAAQWLETCIDSLLTQELDGVEILLVDDGSTDGSGDLCDAAAARSARVRVRHQPNGGVSAARNAGIAMARGEYILFADSDDYLAADHLKTVRAALRAHSGALVCWQLTNEAERLGQSMEQPAVVQPSSAAAALHMAGNLCPVYNKLFRRDILEQEQVAFEGGQSLGEDMMFNLDYLLALKRRVPDFRFAELPAVLYYYNLGNTDSLTHRYDPNFCPREIELFERLRRVCGEDFRSPAEQLTRVDLHYLRTLAEGLALLAEQEGSARAEELLRRPELAELCRRLRAANAYSLYLRAMEQGRLTLMCRVARLKRENFRMYQRLYWAGWWLHRLRTGRAVEVYM